MAVRDIALTIPEIFERINETTKKNEKKKILLDYKYNKALKEILRGVFDDRIVWADFSDVVWAPDDAPLGLNPSHLGMEMKPERIRRFRVENTMGLSHEKIVDLFLDTMASLHSSEANLLMAMFTKTLKCNGLTRRLVKEVFPHLLKE